MNLVGERYGRLTVLESAEPTVYEYGGKPRPYPNWWCKCDCGNKLIVSQSHLRTGHTTSCGCYMRDIVRERNKANKVLNQYDLTGEYGIGYTSDGREFYFDIEDYNKIKNYHWYINADNYVVASEERKSIRMHCIILPTDDTHVPDHIKTDRRFDNRKSNLRIASYSQNSQNHKTLPQTKTGKTGVSFNREKNKWVARITFQNKEIYLGAFNKFSEAVEERTRAEEEYFGKYTYNEEPMVTKQLKDAADITYYLVAHINENTPNDKVGKLFKDLLKENKILCEFIKE